MVYLGLSCAQGRWHIRTALLPPLLLLVGEDAAVVAFGLVPEYSERKTSPATVLRLVICFSQTKMSLEHLQSQTYFPLLLIPELVICSPFQEQEAHLLTNTYITDMLSHSLFPSFLGNLFWLKSKLFGGNNYLG